MPSCHYESTRREFLRQAAGLTAAVTGLAPAHGGQPAAPAAGSRVPVIDCHVHVGSSNLMIHPSTSFADPEETIRNMNEVGVDQSAIFPIEDTHFEAQNRAIAEYCYRTHPGRFIGFAKHNADREKGRIRAQLEHEVRDLGLKGLKMHEPGPSDEIMEAVIELGIPFLYHARPVSRFVEVARSYPKINMILAHLGIPYSASEEVHLEAIEAAKKFPNVYLDTSTVLKTRFLERAIREVPTNQICFGSDAPDCDARLEIFKIRMLKLPHQQEAMILGGNYLTFLDNQGKNVQWKNNKWGEKS